MAGNGEQPPGAPLPQQGAVVPPGGQGQVQAQAQAAAPASAGDVAEIKQMLVGISARQSSLESATRSAAMSGLQLSIDWRSEELQLAHGMLVGAITLLDAAAGKPDALGDVKGVLEVFRGEFESLNEKKPKDKRAWAKREKELITKLGDVWEGAEELGMLASLIKVSGKRKEKEKSKRKDRKSERKSKRGDSDSSSGSDSESGDESDSGKRRKRQKKVCKVHGPGRHDDSECLVQRGYRQAQADAALAHHAAPAVPMPGPVPQQYAAWSAAPSAPRYYCTNCKRSHPPPPAPCYGPRPAPMFAAGSAPAPSNWYAPSLPPLVSVDESVGVRSSSALVSDQAGLRLELRAQATAALQTLPAKPSDTLFAAPAHSVHAPTMTVNVGVVHDAAVEQKMSDSELSKSDRNQPVHEGKQRHPGRVSWEESLNEAKVGCVEEEGDFATRAALGPLIPVLSSATSLAPFTLAQLEQASFQRKVFLAEGVSCRFCAKSGHDFEFCPLRPNEKPRDRQIAFVESLCTTPQVDVFSYRGKSLTEAQSMLEVLGSKLNSGNPWAHATERTKRLKASLGYWKALGANKTVLSFIAYGIPLRFAKQPERLSFRNHRSAMQHAAWVEKELTENVKAGFCVEVKREQARVISPLQVEPKGKNDLRLCVDSRWVNFHLPTPNVRFETPQKNGPDIIGQGDLLFTVDVKKAYYALEMDEEAVPYLCFEFAGKVYASLVLIFGLNLAPGVFHKVMREVVRFLRILGISVLNYLDDFLFSARKERIAALVQFIRWLLPRLGWVFSDDKCSWEPSAVVVFFGLLVDAERFEFRVPTDKLKRVAAVVKMMRDCVQRGEPISVHDLQVLTGTLQSYRVCIEPVQVWTRSMYADIARAGYASRVWVSSDTSEELDFWHSRLEQLNGRTIAHPLATDVLRVDASEFGWGAVLNSTFQASGFLPIETIGKSSTLRELRGLRLASAELAPKPSGKRLRVEMDSYPAVRNLINGGGPVQELCAEVKAWWAWCEQREIKPQYVWIRREENKEADKLSKADGRKWTVRAAVRQAISERWSLLDTEFSAPEFGAIGFVLKLAQRDRRRVGLVYPGWPAQSWWPEIHQRARDVVELGNTRDAYESVSAEKRIGVGEPTWRVFAALLDFRA